MRVFLEARVERDPLDYLAWSRLADEYLRLLRFTGDFAWLEKAGRAAEAALKPVGAQLNSGGLGARGRVELAGHRFAAALATGRKMHELEPQKNGGLLIMGDASFELGDYLAAEAIYKEILQREDVKSTVLEARFARLDLIHGQLDSAAAHLRLALAIAEEQSAPAETRAWVLVQIGELAFHRGDWETAEKSYHDAAETLPGWYVTEEHQAELLAARGQYPEAEVAYAHIVERVPRPELFQALGDVYTFAQQPEQAKPWYAKARVGYEKFALADSPIYWHFGSGFFADSVKEPGAALEWAKKDLALRPTVYAWDTLAWAQSLSGDTPAALTSLKNALVTGIQEPHILYHAGMIQMGAGDIAAGKAALQETVKINPRYNTFHAHR